MVFDIKKSNNKKVEEMYQKAMKELNEFFEIDWNRNMPQLIIVDSRDILNAFSEEKTGDWVVSTTSISGRMIVILSPEKYEEESKGTHKYSDEEYYQLIKHELTHQYEFIFKNEYTPFWFSEGLAEYTSGQIKNMKKPEIFEKFLKYFDYEDGDTYVESAFAVWILIEEFGKKKVIEFLKISDTEDEEEFNKIFKDFFGVELTYDWFNKMLEKRKWFLT